MIQMHINCLTFIMANSIVDYTKRRDTVLNNHKAFLFLSHQTFFVFRIEKKQIKCKAFI